MDRHLFADHLRQQQLFLLEMRKFLTGTLSCQDHDMHESNSNI